MVDRWRERRRAAVRRHHLRGAGRLDRLQPVERWARARLGARGDGGLVRGAALPPRATDRRAGRPGADDREPDAGRSDQPHPRRAPVRRARTRRRRLRAARRPPRPPRDAAGSDVFQAFPRDLRLVVGRSLQTDAGRAVVLMAAPQASPRALPRYLRLVARLSALRTRPVPPLAAVLRRLYD